MIYISIVSLFLNILIVPCFCWLLKLDRKLTCIDTKVKILMKNADFS